MKNQIIDKKLNNISDRDSNLVNRIASYELLENDVLFKFIYDPRLVFLVDNDVFNQAENRAERSSSWEGSERKDVLISGEGDNHLNGDPSQNFLIGGEGNDRLSGGDGHDFLLGENGNDVLGDYMEASIGILGQDAGDDFMDGEMATIV
ncbi:hypothetical protein [Leptolyngbya sp. GB1-A1]|uniref:hypothetical protein n=1 Tax=unclassified Leptolyngbya TaxID=2650499 RepID=UPI001985B685|nr:hypothetical protein [Cyanobacteria bacterium FACHB-502]